MKKIRNPGESIGLKFIPSKSDLFGAIPESISKQSDKHFVSRLMKNGQKSIRINPI